MKHIAISLCNRIFIFVLLISVLACSSEKEVDFAERTKIALRDVGNKLLLINKDSTSLILPVIELEANKFQVKFDTTLSIEPSALVKIVQESFENTKLSRHYRVEVLQCNNREVAYSYQINADEESTIIPCSGRYLPEACYYIEVKFTKMVSGYSTKEILSYSIALLVLIGISFLIYIKKKSKETKQYDGIAEKLGEFYFYPEQNKLVKEAQEIGLSKKECELLALFIAKPNQIIKRDELTKRVWEDNGVFVGRSLDTYISKLRKKLKSDTSIKLTNIHGVGYKLEVE